MSRSLKATVSQMTSLLLLAFSFLFSATQVFAWHNPIGATSIDEVVIHREMRDWLLNGVSADRRSLGGYPPVILFMHYLGHAVMASPSNNWSASYAFDVINLLRWWALLPSLLATALTYVALRFFVSVPAATTATLVLIVSPLITPERINAITEPWQILFVSGTLMSFLMAIRYRNLTWSVLCAVLGCLAVATKYSNFPVLGLGVSAALWLFIHDRRKGIISFLLQAAIISATAVLILFVYDARYLLGVRELGAFFSGGSAAHTNPVRFWEMLYTVAKQFLLSDQLILLGLLAASVIWLTKAISWQRYALGIVAVVTACLLVTTLMYTIHWALISRYLVPVSIFITLGIGIGIQGILTGVDKLIQIKLKDKQLRKALLATLTAVMTALWIAHPIDRWLTVPQGLPRIEHRVVSWLQDRYYDQTLLLSNDVYPWQLLWFYFDKDYSGYKGQLPPWYRGVLGDQPVSAWREMHIRYVWMYSYSRDALMAANPEYFEELTLLRHFRSYPYSAWAGDDVFIYELAALKPTEITFNNGLQIIGWAQQRCEYQEGVLHIDLAPYWRTQKPQPTNLQIFAHVTPVGTSTILQQVDQPVAFDSYPMVDWETEDNAIRGRIIQLQAEVDADVDLQVIIGLYALDTLERVPLSNEQDAVVVCQIPMAQRLHHPSWISSRSP